MIDRDLQIGDLVTHVLYGRGWIGIIIGFNEDTLEVSDKRNKKVLVQIQPGTEFEGFFQRASDHDRVNDNLGYVSIHWLFRIKERDGNTRSSRNKTPSGR